MNQVFGHRSQVFIKEIMLLIPETWFSAGVMRFLVPEIKFLENTDINKANLKNIDINISVGTVIKRHRMQDTGTFVELRLPIDLQRGHFHLEALHAKHRHLCRIKTPYRPPAWALLSKGIARRTPTPL